MRRLYYKAELMIKVGKRRKGGAAIVWRPSLLILEKRMLAPSIKESVFSAKYESRNSPVQQRRWQNSLSSKAKTNAIFITFTAYVER